MKSAIQLIIAETKNSASRMSLPLDALSLAELEWIKSLSIDVYIVATFGVVVGVYWERDGAPEAIKLEGWTLLVKALAIELLVGAILFATDAEISHRQQRRIEAQQSTIISLEKALMPRMLKQFPEGLSLRQFRVPKVSIVTVPDSEAHRLATQIDGLFNVAGWAAPNPTITLDDVRDGVWIEFLDDEAGTSAVKAAAEALREVFSESDIEATVMPLRKGVGANIVLPDAGELRIMVGAKPTSLFLYRSMMPAWAREQFDKAQRDSKKIQEEVDGLRRKGLLH